MKICNPAQAEPQSPSSKAVSNRGVSHPRTANKVKVDNKAYHKAHRASSLRATNRLGVSTTHLWIA